MRGRGRTDARLSGDQEKVDTIFVGRYGNLFNFVVLGPCKDPLVGQAPGLGWGHGECCGGTGKRERVEKGVNIVDGIFVPLDQLLLLHNR